MNSKSSFRRLVLVGAGHAHLQVIRAWRRQPIPSVELVVVSPFDKATYSGMLPATLAGMYEPEQMEIDLKRLTAAAQAELIIDRVTGLDPARREIQLARDSQLEFDVASVNIGSVPAAIERLANHSRVIAIKPMQTFLGRLHEGIDAWRDSRRNNENETERPLRMAVVGGGAAGVEVALCLETRLRKQSIPAELRLIEAGREILAGYNSGTVSRARNELGRREIRLLFGARVADFDDNEGLIFENGVALAVDLVIWAVGAAPPAELGDFRLPKSDKGFLAVGPTLSVATDDPVFAVGDTADFVEQPLAKAGVYAVRQAPVLWRNLRNHFEGRPLIAYRPQRRFLSLMCTGDGRAVLEYRGFSSHSRWAWMLKDWIDRRFVRQFQAKDEE